MELDREKASESVANFLRHVNSGFYDGLVFHRVKPNFMIQAGVLTADMQRRVSTVFPVANEAENGLENVRGAVAMARTSDPHSATSEFFINLIDNPGLDFTEQTPQGWGYAVRDSIRRKRGGGGSSLAELVYALTPLSLDR